jgi:hypothetical protein
MTSLVRVLHIAATCTSLGGLFYARMVLWPTVARLPDVDRDRVLGAAIRRFAPIKWAGVAVVAATGVVQWIARWPDVAARGPYLASFLLKMLGASGLFTITLLLALPAPPLAPLRRRRAFWSGLNIACGVAILLGAALMRAYGVNLTAGSVLPGR